MLPSTARRGPWNAYASVVLDAMLGASSRRAVTCCTSGRRRQLSRQCPYAGRRIPRTGAAQRSYATQDATGAGTPTTTTTTSAPYKPCTRLRLATVGSSSTRALASALARGHRAGDVVMLHGEVGAGKSVFARGFVRACCGDPHLVVPSPTFLLDQTYETGGGLIVHHYDLYRTLGEHDFAGLDLPDAMRTGVCLIEWAQRLGGLVPPERLDVTLAYDTASTVVVEPDEDEDEDVGCNARQVELVAHGGRWQERLARLRGEVEAGAVALKPDGAPADPARMRVLPLQLDLLDAD